jgi:S1-C subfamily serine protease
LFAQAVALAAQFTFPVIISSRRWTGEVGAGIGSFVLVNADGWVVTAAHIFRPHVAAVQNRASIDALNKEIEALQADAAMKPALKLRRTKQIRGRADKNWITNQSYWWARDGVTLVDVQVFEEADLALGRLDPLPADLVKTLPVFKNPSANMSPGTSLCRLGFPFAEVKATYDEGSDTFSVQRQNPFFPLEGMFTRTVGRPDAGGIPVRFIETSAPGLMGHSGGPLFDSQGRVWGIQSRTNHLPLGFRSEIEIAGKKIQVPPQFINLGWAVHPVTITAFLARHGVSHSVSTD